MDTVNMIVEYLANNKVALIAAAGVVSELTVIVVNTIRKLKQQPQMETMSNEKEGFGKKVLWVANPINLFRKV